MDTEPSALWIRNGKRGMLVLLTGMFSLALTGCDTVTSADSHPMQMPTAPAMAGQHNGEQAPAPASNPQTVKTKAPEAAPVTVPVQAASEPRPAPAPAPTTQPKGAERLVTMAAAPQQPRAEALSAPRPVTPALPRQLIVRASTPVSAPTLESASQALIFKGPPRRDVQSGHKFVWWLPGLVLCAVIGGAVAWLRLNPRPKFSRVSSTSAGPKEEIYLPREFNLKEETLPLPDEGDAPVVNTKVEFKDAGQAETTSRLSSVL